MVRSKSTFVNNFLVANIDQGKVLKIFKGGDAVQKAKKLFFGNDTITAADWASSWSSYIKSQSIFVVYLDDQKKFVHFKFVIGKTEDDGSVIGEKYEYVKGLEKMVSLF